MESKIQDLYDAGEAKMEHLCDIVEKIKQFCDENKIDINDVQDAFSFFKEMKWSLK